VAASIEHEPLLRSLSTLNTVADIGANKGQFALVARECIPTVRIISFEPLPGPAAKYRSVFSDDKKAALHEVAIGNERGRRAMHVSKRNDSSSLLSITNLQDQLFPGTAEIGNTEIQLALLRDYLKASDIEPPAMLKIDVQGYELSVLQGCEDIVSKFEFVYVECSFVELYKDQALAHEVIDWLTLRGFYFAGVYNLHYDEDGLAIQGDFLFKSTGHPAATKQPHVDI